MLTFFGSCTVLVILLDERMDGSSQHTTNESKDVVGTLLVDVDDDDPRPVVVTTEVGGDVDVDETMDGDVGGMMLMGQPSSSFDSSTPNGCRGPLRTLRGSRTCWLEEREPRSSRAVQTEKSSKRPVVATTHQPTFNNACNPLAS